VLEQLVHPVHQLDVGVTPHLAEERGSFDALIGDWIELTKQFFATYLGRGHGYLPARVEEPAR
jgi:hypothetical protein